MANLKDKVKQDFINKTDVSFSFDTTKLEDNYKLPKKKFNKKWLFLIVPSATAASLILVVAGVVLANTLKVRESIHITRKQYSSQEMAIIETNTFKRINTVNYPLLTNTRQKNIDEHILSSFNTFSNTIYQALDFEENASFAPITLYPLLSLLAMGSSSPTLDTKFNELFAGDDEATRTELYDTIFKNNFYLNNKSTSLLHNGAFVDYNLGFAPQYLDSLTANYFEAFALDYANRSDVTKMLKWIDESMQEQGFINERDLQVDDETILYFFSSFIFSDEWRTKYVEKDNTNGIFYLNDGSTTMTKYMRHSYLGTYYDYEKYVSFYDYYKNGNRVQYIVPKAHSDNIYTLLGETMFLEETGEERDQQVITLTAPIFKTSTIVDFEKPLLTLGFGEMFDSDNDSFANMFNVKPLTSYVQTIKQKNEVAFNVDGTTIKSLAFAGVGSKDSSYQEDTLIVNLDQPFIYVIRDLNNVPLYIGHYDNPLA